ncbi:hypothetical protein LSAT2_014174 [Lamellibrachia satsuma]|nr:hypothetical protein LSAT2_014174 [Lamellibrachia satsuma]
MSAFEQEYSQTTSALKMIQVSCMLQLFPLFVRVLEGMGALISRISRDWLLRYGWRHQARTAGATERETAMFYGQITASHVLELFHQRRRLPAMCYTPGAEAGPLDARLPQRAVCRRRVRADRVGSEHTCSSSLSCDCPSEWTRFT